MSPNEVRKRFQLMKFLEGLSGSWVYATYILFLEGHDVANPEKFVLNTIFMLGGLIMDPPTGRLGDRIGHWRVYVAGLFMVGVGFLIYGLSDTYTWFIAAELCVAAGHALRSQALESWLRNQTDQEFFHKKRTRANLLMRGGSVIAGYLGTIIGGYYGYWIPWIIGGANFLIMAIVGAVILKNGSEISHVKWSDFPESFKDIGSDVKVALGRRTLRPSFLIYSVLAGLFQPINMLWSLILVSYGATPDHIGYFWIGVSLFLMIGTEMAHRVNVVTFRKMSVATFLTGASITLSALTLILEGELLVMMFWFFCHEIGRGFLQEMLETHRNEHIAEDERAFVNSVIDSVRTFGSAVGLIVFGQIVRLITDPLHVWIISASCMLAFGVAVWFFKQR